METNAVTSRENPQQLLVKPKERPILFSGRLVRAILDGRKTQTRRIIKPQPDDEEWGDWMECRRYHPEMVARNGDLEPGPEVFGFADAERGWKCPYGEPGTRLWVRETWAANDTIVGWAPIWKISTAPRPLQIVYRADGDWADQFEQIEGDCPPWRPSIHMPRWVSRIDLEVTGIRVERLKDISEQDAKAEGPLWDEILQGPPSPRTYTNLFANLWDGINAPRGFGWEANPWVWVVEFKTVRQPAQTVEKEGD